MSRSRRAPLAPAPAPTPTAGAAHLEDALVALLGARADAAPAPDAARPPDAAALAFAGWLAHDAAAAQSPLERRRTARRAADFARTVRARRDVERAGALLGAAAPPPPEWGAAPRPLADAVAHGALRGAAPRLDLRVAAGAGRALWEQACDRWLPLPPDLPPGGRHVAVGVAGDSMQPLLLPGDTLLVRLGAEPVPGALVVARGRGEGYVVKLVGRVTARTIELRSLNPAYAPFRVRRAPGAVLGAVVRRWRG